MARLLRKFEVFTRFCEDLAKLSNCNRLQVAAIVVDIDFQNVHTIGINGPASGRANSSCTSEAGQCGCIHAEMNALIKLGNERGVMIATHAPCVLCHGLIINSRKIVSLYYRDSYRKSVPLTNSHTWDTFNETTFRDEILSGALIRASEL